MWNFNENYDFCIKFQIIAEVSTESRKRDVLESAISLDLSEDLFRSVGDEEIAEGSDSKERRDSESFPVHIVNNEDVSTSAKERNQIANKRMSRSFASKRPKKIKVIFNDIRVGVFRQLVFSFFGKFQDIPVRNYSKRILV